MFNDIDEQVLSDLAKDETTIDFFEAFLVFAAKQRVFFSEELIDPQCYVWWQSNVRGGRDNSINTKSVLLSMSVFVAFIFITMLLVLFH